ncbi:DUF2271 domain-containing protein [Sphingosinithalassobacter sp. CS137]|uniref:DUF2271 domain-containing protein n=1 Tax=Sphingosinithalassobacter sp. CS137 TaxID=2762748 RepID=UPI00165E90FA|nr:DUF2271 domain-containing protein [Sphingosinithalassobacter sp. CS137]
MLQLRFTGLTAAAIGAGSLFAGPAAAQTLDLSVEVPRLSVAEYHKPYVAVWLEKEGATPRTLAVWYDLDMRGNEGTKWLRDMRQWWRASGRSMSFPADGVSSATKAPGTHRMRFTAGTAPMPRLTPGNYVLHVEAAREVGGRELVRLPFRWPASGATTVTEQGSSELGAVRLTVR